MRLLGASGAKYGEQNQRQEDDATVMMQCRRCKTMVGSACTLCTVGAASIIDSLLPSKELQQHFVERAMERSARSRSRS